METLYFLDLTNPNPWISVPSRKRNYEGKYVETLGIIFFSNFIKVNFTFYLVSSKIEKFNLKLSINTGNKKRAQEFI